MIREVNRPRAIAANSPPAPPDPLAPPYDVRAAVDEVGERVLEGDNLRDVLYFYLMNGRSVSATAERLYLHRNTIMNKVKKIQSILNVDLEDRHVRQRLIFSCQVLRYFEGMQIAQDDVPKV